MHPDESMLLAYIRQQPCGDKTEAIQRHITSCSTCQRRYAEYVRIGKAFESWSHTYPYCSYPPVADRVMQRIQTAETPVTHRLFQARLKLLSLPIALALVILSVLIALAHLPSGSNLAKRLTSIVGQSTAVQYQTGLTPHPQPTQPVISAATPTVSVTSTTPIISVCTTNEDRAHSHVRICGTNFTPGSHVFLLLSMREGTTKRLKAVQVTTQGKMQMTFTVHDCAELPTAIIAKDENDTAEQSQVLKDIPSSNCKGAKS